MFKIKNEISILGVASDLGANQAGSRMGPDAIRISGLHRKLEKLGYTVADKGNITTAIRKFGKDGVENYLKEIVTINKSIINHCSDAFKLNNIPLTIGGDHSIAIGTVAASANQYKNLGLIWIDTHADMNNPESSLTNNIHGMPLSTLLHDGFKTLVALVKTKLVPENIVLIGLRDVDETERKLLKESKVMYYTMRDVDELGIQGVFSEVNSQLVSKLDHLHVSFDLDVMDPIHAPGVSTPIDGGLTSREAHLLLELLHETTKVRACDFVELNPMRDIQGKSAELMTNLIASLFGSTII
ncbi:MAG: arginase [Glaciecola sp.]|jgi:arginase